MRRLIQTAFVSLCFACAVPAFPSVTMADEASDRAQVDSNVNSALNNLYASVPGSQQIVARAAGVLVFPDITKAGFIVGGQHGNGALLVGGRTVAYYSCAPIIDAGTRA